jgi:HSP20 family molecular chaperone IbpA
MTTFGDNIMANNQQELQEKTENGLTSAQPNKLYVPDVDVFETDENIVILAAMPGVSENSVDVTLDKNILRIDGSVEASHFDGYSPAYVEYEAGHYRRSFTLSDRIDRDKIEASVHNGLLSLTLAKTDLPQARKIEIQAV